MGKGKIIEIYLCTKTKTAIEYLGEKKKELFEELRTHVNLRGTLKSFWYS